MEHAVNASQLLGCREAYQQVPCPLPEPITAFVELVRGQRVLRVAPTQGPPKRHLHLLEKLPKILNTKQWQEFQKRKTRGG